MDEPRDKSVLRPVADLIKDFQRGAFEQTLYYTGIIEGLEARIEDLSALARDLTSVQSYSTTQIVGIITDDDHQEPEDLTKDHPILRWVWRDVFDHKSHVDAYRTHLINEMAREAQEMGLE